ncbi:hypothetical protein [Pyxidicoccus sp. MSG2]|uniref:hypothetical protein n=1 Tax=Pyxidicoccus sp. MSG2 TaxID=2996790 RepID=UPI002270B92E|nr:hypothetical protein [Pyxidicoccus sp. MSG2]MCY1022743.1 hypothetical protein [Pyxidicoccus sp. MSG2]
MAAEVLTRVLPSPVRRARALLMRAAALYDAPGSPLAREARSAWPGGFRGGAAWMAGAMSHVRGQPVRAVLPGAQALGLLKYASALLAAVGAWGMAVFLGLPHAVGLLLAVPAFYAVEVQGLFLFPLALDGAARPWRSARSLLREAGGTAGAMGTVLVLAAVMVFGGLAGRGLVRCWCLGCLAVVLWYEELKA